MKCAFTFKPHHLQFLLHFPRNVDGPLVNLLNGVDSSSVDADLGVDG